MKPYKKALISIICLSVFLSITFWEGYYFSAEEEMKRNGFTITETQYIPINESFEVIKLNNTDQLQAYARAFNVTTIYSYQNSDKLTYFFVSWVQNLYYIEFQKVDA